MSDESARLREAPPDTGTAQLVEYLWADSCDLSFFSFIIDSTLQSDYFEYGVFSVLDGHEKHEYESPTELVLKKPGERAKVVRRSRQEFLEMFLSRLVDNFQVYVVDIVRAVLRRRPEILSGRKQEVTLGYILKFSSIESLIHDIVEAKVSTLSYEGFGELQKWCDDRGIPLVVTEVDRDRMVDLIATRNLIVHNRGLVDARYLKAVPSSGCREGDKRLLDGKDFVEATALFNRIAIGTDRAVAEKFDLPRLVVARELEERWRVRKAATSTAQPGAREA